MVLVCNLGDFTRRFWGDIDSELCLDDRVAGWRSCAPVNTCIVDESCLFKFSGNPRKKKVKYKR